jgi:hypothetical protein
MADEITIGLAEVLDQLHEAQIRYAQARVTIGQRRLALFDLGNTRMMDGVRAACERFEAIEKADETCQSFRSVIANKAERLRDLEAQYERFFSKGMTGSPSECEFFARAALDALSRLSDWANDADSLVHSKRMATSAQIARQPERSESRGLSRAWTLIGVPAVHPSAALGATGKRPTFRGLAPLANQATDRWHSSTLSAIRRCAAERQKTERRPK